jgi:hypothetical protein
MQISSTCVRAAVAACLGIHALLFTALRPLMAANFAATNSNWTVTILENFDVDPRSRGWRIVGDDDLFRWNSTNRNLEVTWDSSRPNSYFSLPLGTILSRADDFSVSIDLLLTDIAAGVDPTKPGTFQIAFGFQNHTDAIKTNFFRAGANSSPNLLEFDFFPDRGFGPTVWPGILSTNSALNYSGNGDFGLFDLPTDLLLHVSLSYDGSTERATITIAANGTPIGWPVSARLATNNVAFGGVFTQFRLDAFAIASYNDTGQNPSFAGSILAHGIVDNLVLTFPSAPVQDLVAARIGNVTELGFRTRTNWNYRVEATADFKQWMPVSDWIRGDRQARLHDTNAAVFPDRFYRVQSQRAD